MPPNQTPTPNSRIAKIGGSIIIGTIVLGIVAVVMIPGIQGLILIVTGHETTGLLKAYTNLSSGSGRRGSSNYEYIIELQEPSRHNLTIHTGDTSFLPYQIMQGRPKTINYDWPVPVTVNRDATSGQVGTKSHIWRHSVLYMAILVAIVVAAAWYVRRQMRKQPQAVSPTPPPPGVYGQSSR